MPSHASTNTAAETIPASHLPTPLLESDVRALIHLLGDTLAYPGPDIDRKRFLLTGLARLVEADAWAWVAQKGGHAPGDVTYFSLIDGGWKSEQQLTIATQATWCPDNQPIHDLMTMGIFAGTRRDAYEDVPWYSSELFKRFREPAGLDDIMVTGVRYTADLVSLVGLHRNLGRPPFGERERRLAHILTSEIEWLHRVGLPDADLSSVDQLSPRLRHVMLLLLSGSSRKQIAAQLAISNHTVNEYIADIYSRLGVSSRASLMARFIQGRADA